MKGKIALLVGICLLALALDQASKFWAVGALTKAFDVEEAATLGEKARAFLVMENLEPLRRKPVVVVENHWRFRYLENPGAAWGLLGSLEPHLRLPFFRIAPLVAMALLVGLYLRAQRRQLLLRISLALIVGGALGNLTDRWIRGYVIDFVDWHWHESHWPTFNVADVAISLGIVGVGLDGARNSLRRRRERDLLAQEEEAASEYEEEIDSPTSPVGREADIVSSSSDEYIEGAGDAWEERHLEDPKRSD